MLSYDDAYGDGKPAASAAADLEACGGELHVYEAGVGVGAVGGEQTADAGKRQGYCADHQPHGMADDHP